MDSENSAKLSVRRSMKSRVIEPLLDNHMRHREKTGTSVPGFSGNHRVGPVDHFYPARIDDDQLGAVLFDCGFHLQGNDWMGFGSIGTGHQKTSL